MVLEISSGVLERIVEEANRAPEREVCGLLLGADGRIADAVPCRNVAADAGVAFEIDPAQLIAAHRAARDGGPAIAGCYHSHPRGPALPSARDAAAAVADGAIWLIVAGGAVRCFRAVDRGQHHGRFDAVAYRVRAAVPL